MSTSYSSFCDDFSVDLYVNTELALPSERDTLLTFFERIQKQFPEMGNFYRRDNGDFCLEGDRDSGQYKWTAVEIDRLGVGVVNPDDLNQAYELDKAVLDVAPYMLGLSHLDIESLDVTFALDFDYQGNHDEVIAEAFFSETAFASLFNDKNSKPVSFSPAVIFALDDDCRLQARLTIESHTGVYELRTGKYKDEPITLFFTIRQYPSPDEKFDAAASFEKQFELIQELMNEKILPNFVSPLTSAIAHRQ